MRLLAHESSHCGVQDIVSSVGPTPRACRGNRRVRVGRYKGGWCLLSAGCCSFTASHNANTRQPGQFHIRREGMENNQPRPIQDAIREFDPAAHRQAIDGAKRERQEAVDRFPLTAWPSLPLQRYALGQGSKQDAFCWWMEFGTPNVGSMKGGSARKHIIYRQNDGAWYFDHETYDTVENAWHAVREVLCLFDRHERAVRGVCHSVAKSVAWY